MAKCPSYSNIINNNKLVPNNLYNDFYRKIFINVSLRIDDLEMTKIINLAC